MKSSTLIIMIIVLIVVSVMGFLVKRALSIFQSNRKQPPPPFPPVNPDPQILRLVAEGRKLAAIKRSRELYQIQLKEAKNYVEHLIRERNQK